MVKMVYKPTFSNAKVGKQPGLPLVTVESQPVIDQGGGEPHVIDDQGLFPQIRRFEKVDDAEHPASRVIVPVIRRGEAEIRRERPAVGCGYPPQHDFRFRYVAVGQEPSRDEDFLLAWVSFM